MTKEEIIAELDKLNIEYPEDAIKAELEALLPQKEEAPVETAEEMELRIRREERERIAQEYKEKEEKEFKSLDKQIKTIQKKGEDMTEEEKKGLNDLLVKRAQYNASQPRDLDKLYPSQMTLEEMLQYCDSKMAEAEKVGDEAEKRRAESLQYKDGDSTKKMQLRIKAYRNPGARERLDAYDRQQIAGKIVNVPLRS